MKYNEIILIICCILTITVSFIFISCDNKKTDNEFPTHISESTSTDESIESGGYIECIHNAVGSYHSIPYKLLEYVGYEEAIKWIDATSEKSSKENDINCIHKYCNIYDFIHYFDVPKDVFVDIYYKNLYYTHNYDI
jgi:hypothetical protein